MDSIKIIDGAILGSKHYFFFLAALLGTCIEKVKRITSYFSKQN
jgi:hypothetical protein